MVDAASSGEVAGIEGGLGAEVPAPKAHLTEPSSWYTEEMVDRAEDVLLEYYEYEIRGTTTAVRQVFESIAPMVEKLLADRENAAAHAAQSAMGSGLDTWRF